MRRLNIALVAHDSRKKELLEWISYNVKILRYHNIIATGTTSKLIKELKYEERESDYAKHSHIENLHVISVLSGPLGGDQIIGAMIAQGQVDVLIFFCDNLITQGHQTDISALTRLASLYNIAFASNRTTVDMILTSSLFGDEEYEPKVQDFNEYLNRKL